MATVPKHLASTEVHYPDSDGKPVGETPFHVRNLLYGFELLQTWFAAEPTVYVAGNMFLYYVEGDRNRHVSPDIFVVRGIVPKSDRERRKYLLWEEAKAPDLVIEMTSESTEEEDRETKMAIYRDILRVSEYFLFDPFAEWLEPRLQGYRLRGRRYGAIRPVEGRLPSKVLGLHLEAVEEMLRFYDPKAAQWLLTAPEVREAQRQGARARRREARARRAAEEGQRAAEEGRRAAEEGRRAAEEGRRAAEEARRAAEAESERLSRELDKLRRGLPPTP